MCSFHAGLLTRLVSLPLLLAAVLPFAACRRAAAPSPPNNPLGIEALGVQLLADGDLARLDYRVVDEPRARAAFAGELRLYADGGSQPLRVMDVGRLGPLRQRPTVGGRRQFVLFTNPGRVLRRAGTAVLVCPAGRLAGIPVS